MAYSIVIRRRCCIAGQPVEVGATVEVTASTARSLLDCGHELADADDAEALRDELRAEFEALAVEAPVFSQSPEAAQQQARDFEAAMKPRPRMGFLP
jgi:hypothetical protein